MMALLDVNKDRNLSVAELQNAIEKLRALIRTRTGNGPSRNWSRLTRSSGARPVIEVQGKAPGRTEVEDEGRNPITNV